MSNRPQISAQIISLNSSLDFCLALVTGPVAMMRSLLLCISLLVVMWSDRALCKSGMRSISLIINVCIILMNLLKANDFLKMQTLRGIL